MSLDLGTPLAVVRGPLDRVIRRAGVRDVVAKLAKTPRLAVDTETTGFYPYRGDRLFSVIFADEAQEYYFNFNAQQLDVPKNLVLPYSDIQLLAPIFQAPGLLIGHNLKFDLHFLAQEGITFEREFWCTEAQARVEYNDHLKYSLEACGSRIGVHKDDAVKSYLDSHSCYEWITYPGKKKREKRYFFDRVPLEIIAPYGCRDARVSYALAERQRESFDRIDRSVDGAPISPVVENEKKVTRVFFKMERGGFRIDRSYCRVANDYELSRARDCQLEWQRLTGTPLVDSAVALRDTLVAHGIKPGKTDTGRDSFTDDVLRKYIPGPQDLVTASNAGYLAKIVLDHRDAIKRSSTYFSNFLTLAGEDDRIHPNLRQGGTVTGRVACKEPNLQNLTAEDDSLYPVRRAFIPDEDGWLVSCDYSQQEYRLMLDYAGEEQVIDDILRGMDVHEACAKLMGVTRTQAKTINFALLYGAGLDKLADMLRVELEEAALLRAKYFQALRRVQKFIRNVTQTAERRRYIRNWLGRRSHYADPRFAYKAPNSLIQGGSADIMKLALVRMDEFLTAGRALTKLLVTVHDEALLWVPYSERALVPELVEIMRKAYPHKRLPMECSVAYSDKSWHDMVDGMPAAEGFTDADGSKATP
jgi:DNA polymerase-1